MTKREEEQAQLWGRTKDGEWQFVRFGIRAAVDLLASRADHKGHYVEFRSAEDRPTDPADLTARIWDRAQQLAGRDDNTVEPRDLDLMKNPSGAVHPLWYSRTSVTAPANNPYLGQAMTQLAEEGWRLA